VKRFPSPRRFTTACAVVTAIVAGCLFAGDPAPTAVVNGQAYGVSVVRGLVLTGDELTFYGRIERAHDSSAFLDDQAYALTGVDPETFIVVRAKPGLRDDAGPWGDFMGLFGAGQDRDLCAYFTRLGPTWCD